MMAAAASPDGETRSPGAAAGRLHRAATPPSRQMRGEELASLHFRFPRFRDRLSLQILARRSREVMTFGPPDATDRRPAGGAAGSLAGRCDQRGTTAVASISTF